MKRLVIRYIFWLLAFGVMAIIFYFSSQSGTSSSQTSGGITEIIITVFNPQFKGLDAAEKQQVIANAQGAVRVSAHFLSYAALGLFTSAALMTYNFGIRRIISFSLAICFFYALSDEAHQLFTEGRAFELFDLFIDSTGAAAGTAAAFLTAKIFKIKR